MKMKKLMYLSFFLFPLCLLAQKKGGSDGINKLIQQDDKFVIQIDTSSVKSVLREYSIDFFALDNNERVEFKFNNKKLIKKSKNNSLGGKSWVAVSLRGNIFFINLKKEKFKIEKNYFKKLLLNFYEQNNYIPRGGYVYYLSQEGFKVTEKGEILEGEWYPKVSYCQY